MDSGPSAGPGGAAPGSTGSAGSSASTCFRHPGREAYVSCVRCGRLACPDCLRSAAVGQQCVECVHDRGSRAASARTAFGGRIGTGAAVTWTLVAVNVALYLLELARPSLVDQFGMIGVASSHGAVVGVAAGQWYRLITSAFLAPGVGGLGVMDVVFNMWALIVIGPSLERMLGGARYLAVYLLSAVGGSVLLYFLAPRALALGASGAIFGLFGAWFVVSRRLRLNTRWIVGLIAINLVLDFMVPDIAWQDHLGGLAVGAALTAAYAYAPRSRRLLTAVGATAAVAALLALAVVLQNAHFAALGV